MATQLVDFTIGRTVSSDVTIEAGATQTLQGVFIRLPASLTK